MKFIIQYKNQYIKVEANEKYFHIDNICPLVIDIIQARLNQAPNDIKQGIFFINI